MTTPQLISILEIKTDSKRPCELASKIGKKCERVKEWKSGTEMRFSTAFEICSKLGIDLIQLLSEKK